MNNPLEERWPHGVVRSETDLYYLAGATSQFMRESCRVVTFSATKLQIWKITSALQDMTEGVAQRLDMKFMPGEKYFSAEIIGEFPRSLLLGSINSLAVYQYLNRGTFRPFFRCYPDAFTDKSKNRWLLDTQKLDPFWGQAETAYGAWVRLYLNSLEREPKWPVLPHLNAAQIRELIPFVVSPAQLETAAMYFAQDLGLTVDIGSGKGLDKVDVTASVRHKGIVRDELVRAALDLCVRNGLVLGERVTTNLCDTYALSIQCKNYGAIPDSVEQGILMFYAHGPSPMQTGIVTLQHMMESQRPEFTNLNDWVALVGSQISGVAEQKSRLRLVA